MANGVQRQMQHINKHLVRCTVCNQANNHKALRKQLLVHRDKEQVHPQVE